MSDFEEFEKKWIVDITTTTNKQFFKTASAYELAVNYIRFLQR